MFYGHFSFLTQWYWLDDHQRQFRLLSGKCQVKVRLMSGKKSRSNFKIDIFAQKGTNSMQLITGNPMGGLSFGIRGTQRQKKIEFEYLTSSILNKFFLPYICQK